MKTAYVYNEPEGLVKIVENKNGHYDIYRLERVTAYRKPSRMMDMRCTPHTANDACRSCPGNPGGNNCALRLAFEFSAKPIKTWSYKPYEDADVSSTPNQFFGIVKRMCPHIIDLA